MSLVIGLIDYLNTMPFHYDLAERLQDVDVHFERGVPSQMNRMLKSGEIDLAPISAIETARHADDGNVCLRRAVPGILSSLDPELECIFARVFAFSRSEMFGKLAYRGRFKQRDRRDLSIKLFLQL